MTGHSKHSPAGHWSLCQYWHQWTRARYQVIRWAGGQCPIGHLAEEQGAVLGAVKLGPVALHQLHPLQRLVQRSEVLLQTLVGSEQGSK